MYGAESALWSTLTSLMVSREGAQNARPVCGQPCDHPGRDVAGWADVLTVRVSSMWGPVALSLESY